MRDVNKLDIYNDALGRLGVGRLLASLNDTSKEAQACERQWVRCLDLLLAKFWWRFATTAGELQNNVEISPEDLGWEYAYLIPEDCVTPRFLWSGSRVERAQDRIPFEIAADVVNGGSALFADIRPATLIYTRRVPENEGGALVGLPEAFIDALTWKLAAKIALPLGIDPGLAQYALQQEQRALVEARTNDILFQTDRLPTSELFSARG